MGLGSFPYAYVRAERTVNHGKLAWFAENQFVQAICDAGVVGLGCSRERCTWEFGDLGDCGKVVRGRFL